MVDAGVDPQGSTPAGLSRSVSPSDTAVAAGQSRSSSPRRTVAAGQSRSSSPRRTAASSPRPQPLNQKRRRMTRDEESLDQALLQDILDSRERRAKTAETPKNPEIHFGLDIAERLNCLNPRQKAVAKLRIQRVMLEVEFPEQTTPPPSSYASQAGYFEY